MQAAAVCAALRNARRKEGQIDLEALDRVIAEAPTSSLERMEAIGRLLADVEQSALFSLDSSKARNKSSATVSAAQVKGLIQVVEARIQRSTAYRRLLGTFLFFLSFFLVLYLQQDITRAYEVESSIVNAVVEKLPKMGQGGFQVEYRAYRCVFPLSSTLDLALSL